MTYKSTKFAVTDSLNVSSEKNLLDGVVTGVELIDDNLVAKVERVTISGMTIDIVSNITKINPPRNEQKQVQFIGDDDTAFLLLQTITIRIERY